MKYRDRKQQRKWRFSAVVVVVDRTVCCYLLLLFLLKETSCARSKKLFQKRQIKRKKLKVSELYRPTFQLLIGTFQLESVLISATRLSVSRSLNLKISDFRIHHLTNECVCSEPSFVFITFSLFFLIALREMNRL